MMIHAKERIQITFGWLLCRAKTSSEKVRDPKRIPSRQTDAGGGSFSNSQLHEHHRGVNLTPKKRAAEDPRAYYYAKSNEIYFGENHTDTTPTADPEALGTLYFTS
jgi:hypothetical protein